MGKYKNTVWCAFIGFFVEGSKQYDPLAQGHSRDRVVAVFCSVLQYGSVWCSVVQCGAVSCSVFQCLQAAVLKCVTVTQKHKSSSGKRSLLCSSASTMHTFTHTQIDAHTNTRLHSCTNTHTLTHTRTHIRTHRYTHKHTQTHTHKCTRTRDSVQRTRLSISWMGSTGEVVAREVGTRHQSPWCDAVLCSVVQCVAMCCSVAVILCGT